MKISICLFTCLFYASSSFAQSSNSDTTVVKKKERFKVGLEGIAAVSFGNDVVAINVGGPALKLKLSPKWGIGVGAFPSLYISHGKVEPKLGLAPRVDYGNFILIVPGYYISKTEKWIWTVGAGYKFH
jgi:hypothetical protein